MLIAFQNQLIYMGYLPPGSRCNEDFRQSIPPSLSVREETITTCDKKRLHGFIVTKKQQQQQQQQASTTTTVNTTNTKKSFSNRGPVMIYFQGNAGNMSDRFDLFKSIIAAIPKLTIVGITYRQYGNSEGYATEHGLKKDACAILKTVRSIYGYDSPIYLYGHSLGGAVALDLATAATIQAKYCLWNHWDNHITIRKLPSTLPILLLSSEHDEIVPSFHMKRLYTLARNNHIHNATFINFSRSLHMNIYSAEPRLFKSALRDFIKDD
ncbi:Alpha/Beta hydrolase protein [Chlamydoabsidia padenii]|nr:Alpha/Beta hydrolase protein [Chlamydoabsidia padenii]